MLTVREADAGVAAMLKAPAGAVAHYTRMLREAEPPLWFRAGRGHRDAPLTAAHLVNLVLAFAGGSPVDAAATVARLRALAVAEIRRPAPHAFQELFLGELPAMQAPVEAAGVMIFPTLGETLDRCAAAGSEICVAIELGDGNLQATLSPIWEDSQSLVMFWPTEAAEHPADTTATISQTAHLWPPLFGMMAALLRAAAPDPADNQLSAPSSSASASPENESGALPGAPPSDQHRANGTGHQVLHPTRDLVAPSSPSRGVHDQHNPAFRTAARARPRYRGRLAVLSPTLPPGA